MRFDLFNTLVEKHLQIPCYRLVDLLTWAHTNHIVINFPNPYNSYNYFAYMDGELLTLRTEFHGKDQNYSLYSGSMKDIFGVERVDKGSEIVGLTEEKVIEYCNRLNYNAKILAVKLKKYDIEKDFR